VVLRGLVAALAQRRTLGLNRYRALRVYVDYAEAFFVSDAAEFVELTRNMNTL
jgi:hypothetical protein